jgi:hypothetical protein
VADCGEIARQNHYVFASLPRFKNKKNESTKFL